jgi:hypothetical protein
LSIFEFAERSERFAAEENAPAIQESEVEAVRLYIVSAKQKPPSLHLGVRTL